MKLPIEKAAMKYKASLSTGEVLMTLRDMVAAEKEAGCDSDELPEALREQCKKKEKEGEENDEKEKKEKKASAPTSVEGWIRWED